MGLAGRALAEREFDVDSLEVVQDRAPQPQPAFRGRPAFAAQRVGQRLRQVTPGDGVRVGEQLVEAAGGHHFAA